MKRYFICMAVAATLAATGCKKDATSPPPADAKPVASDSFRDNPDFGGVKSVSVETEGVGPTPSIAVLRALDQAIVQVNGRRVASTSDAVSAGVHIDVSSLGSAQVDGDAYVERVVSASDGVIRSFTVLSKKEVARVDAEYSFDGEANSGGWLGDSITVKESEKVLSHYWTATVRAEVAKFVGPKDDGRPKLVVAGPRTSSGQYEVGDNRVGSAEVAAEIRARLSDALTQTDRFQVLDREFNDEMQSEVDFINSGNARSEEVARLGQRLATDLILVPTIERFAYPRSSRQLQMSNRELVSYSGGGRVSLRLINATTGEVVMSESFDHQLPRTAPSTLARAVDGVGMAGTMMDSLSSRMVKAVVNEIFPVSVIAVSGNQVVLSQGGKSVAQGDRYDAVLLGDALRDPQTGRSLGRMETPCCVVRIDRVADKTSYGTIEGDAPAQLASFKPGMVELRGLAAVAAPSAVEASTGTMERVTTTVAARADVQARSARTGPKGAEAQTAASDENW